MIHTFKAWCQKILPLVYDDSLSYYELLCKVIKKLNDIIELVNQNENDITELKQLFQQLKTYVENYFTNLDVQEGINNKLDEMANDGTLANLLNPYVLYSADNALLYNYHTITDSSKYVSWPNTCITSSGKMICVYNKGEHHNPLNSSKSVVYKTSDNYGFTWSDEQYLFESSSDSETYQCYGIIQSLTGSILVPISKGVNGVQEDAFYIYNENMELQTQSTPFTNKGLTYQPFINYKNGNVYAFRSVVNAENPEQRRCEIVYSTNGGLNWSVNGVTEWETTSDYSNQPWECHGICTMGAFFGVGRNQNGRAYLMKSSDGISWEYTISNLIDSGGTPLAIINDEKNFIISYVSRSTNKVYVLTLGIDAALNNFGYLPDPICIGFTGKETSVDTGYMSMNKYNNTLYLTYYTTRYNSDADTTAIPTAIIMQYYPIRELYKEFRTYGTLSQNNDFAHGYENTNVTTAIACPGFSYTATQNVTNLVRQWTVNQGRYSIEFNTTGTTKLQFYQPIFLQKGVYGVHVTLNSANDYYLKPYIKYNNSVLPTIFNTYRTPGFRDDYYNFYIDGKSNNYALVGVEITFTDSINIYGCDIYQGWSDNEPSFILNQVNNYAHYLERFDGNCIAGNNIVCVPLGETLTAIKKLSFSDNDGTNGNITVNDESVKPSTILSNGCAIFTFNASQAGTFSIRNIIGDGTPTT